MSLQPMNIGFDTPMELAKNPQTHAIKPSEGDVEEEIQEVRIAAFTSSLPDEDDEAPKAQRDKPVSLDEIEVTKMSLQPSNIGLEVPRELSRNRMEIKPQEDDVEEEVIVSGRTTPLGEEPAMEKEDAKSSETPDVAPNVAIEEPTVCERNLAQFQTDAAETATEELVLNQQSPSDIA